MSSTDDGFAATDHRVIETVNNLWFDWSERKGRGSAEFTNAVAREAVRAVLTALRERQALIPPASDDEPFALGFDSAVAIVEDRDA